MDQENKGVLNPWWYLLWVALLATVGYFTEGRIGAIEGAVVATVLALAALIELLRNELLRKKTGE